MYPPPTELRARTKTASLHAIQLYRSLSDRDESRIVGLRMFRTLTRAGACYRAAIRCRKLRSYLHRLDAALYELELAAYWLELMLDASISPPAQTSSLLTEVHELMAILVSCRKSARKLGNKRVSLSSS